MSPGVVIAIGACVVAVIVAIAVANARRRNDGVDSFRRQIDALSPEARRNVIDQVQNAAERRERAGDDDGDDDVDDGGEDGPRGT